MLLSDFDYYLPDELIAQFPLPERTQSRLLHLDGINGTFIDRHFSDFVNLVATGDLLVFNDTKVIKARLWGQKESGGKIEILVERVLSSHEVLAHIRASHAPKAGSRLRITDAFTAQMVERREDLFLLRFENETNVLDLLDRFGTLPLPPYIAHAPDQQDETRYQTVYARTPGAVAAPTAGLHFSSEILDRLRESGVGIAYVTLHVGAGTFQPVRVENIAEHHMHSEWYQIPDATTKAIETTRTNRKQVIAIGTTTLRALESAADESGQVHAGFDDTSIFITPGYRFRVVDRLLTNFHLPKSTLLMLISAFGGLENVRRAYQHAVKSRYRFFSYGDAMLIEKQNI